MANLVSPTLINHPAWNVALSALDWSIKQGDMWQRNYRWKYFSLNTLPLKTETSSSNGIEYNAYDKYIDVQSRIERLVNLTVRDIGTESSIGHMNGLIKQTLIDLKNQAIDTEAHLFAEVVKDDSYIFEYKKWADLTFPGVEYNTTSTIRMWTELALTGEIGGLVFFDWTKVKDSMAFALFVGSKDFYNEFLLRKKPCMDSILEEINVYAASGATKTRVPIRDVIQRYFTQIVNTIGDAFVNDKKIGAKYADLIAQSIQQSIKNPKHSAILKVSTGDEAKAYQIKNFYITTDEYNDFFSALYPKLNQIVKEMNNEPRIQYPITFELTTDKNTKPFFISGEGNAILNTQPTITKQQFKNGEIDVKTSHLIVNNVIKQMVIALRNLNNKGSIDCLSLGKIDFGGDMSNYSRWLNAAIEYCEKNFSSLLGQRIQRNPDLWKSFYARKSNTFFSGLYGEIVGLSNFYSLVSNAEYKTKLTGGKTSQIRGKNIGGSVNDLIFSKDISIDMGDGNTKRSYKRYGVNIKHYIQQKSSTFKLYGKTGKNGLFTSYTAKYLNNAQLNLVRFILANSQYFIQDSDREISIENLIMNIALGAIPSYLRVSDRTRSSADNLFYQINNVIYPVSYIYTCALEQLDYLLGRTQDKKSFMSVIITTDEDGNTNLDEGSTYRNLANARRYWKENNYRLATSGKPKGKNAKIQTHGLGINLVSFGI